MCCGGTQFSKHILDVATSYNYYFTNSYLHACIYNQYCTYIAMYMSNRNTAVMLWMSQELTKYVMAHSGILMFTPK